MDIQRLFHVGKVTRSRGPLVAKTDHPIRIVIYAVQYLRFLFLGEYYPSLLTTSTPSPTRFTSTVSLPRGVVMKPFA